MRRALGRALEPHDERSADRLLQSFWSGGGERAHPRGSVVVLVRPTRP